MIGSTLGHYEIIEPLGAGGMGEVYRARDTELKRHVAVKFLPPHLATDETAMARFRREAEMLAAVNHPGIATIYSIEEANDNRFLVLELVEGETLAARLGRGPIPQEESLEISSQIADALEAAHERGIVHRDLKPANVMIGPGGRVKVLDFGLALPFLLGQGTDLTQASTDFDKITSTGTFMGTAPYMSPEQVRGQAVDPRTDIWAFGCVLYEMLTGRRAFLRDTMADTMAAILEREPDWGALPDDTSPEIRALLRTSLRKDSGERPQEMSGACLDIRRALTAGGQTDYRASHVKKLPLSAPLAAAGAVILGLLIIGLALNVAGLRDRLLGGWWEPGAMAVVGAGERPRIVVLPFENLSGEEEEYFSEGITHDISTQISKIGNFVVIATGSARIARDSGGGYGEMAEQLRVDYIIDGSVTQAGDRVRITASLIDPGTDEQLWANDYDRELSAEHIFSVRSDVAEQVASALDVTLSPEEQAQLAAQPTQDLEAYREYQLGRFHWDKRTIEGFELAIGHFEQAIALDPDYALAYAGLADTYLLLPWFSSEYSNEEGLARTVEAANRAIELDPTLGEPHTALGLVYEWQFDWKPSEREFERGLQLSPERATAHHWYANMLARLGRHEEATEEIRTALDLDPLSLIINQDVGYVASLGGDLETAIAQFRRVMELDPNFSATQLVLALWLIQAGDFAESEMELIRWAGITGNDPSLVRQVAVLAKRHAESGEMQAFPAVLAVESTFPPYALPYLYLSIGDRNRAMDLLEQAYEDNAFAIVSGVTSPVYDSLRSEPQFIELLRKIGLEP